MGPSQHGTCLTGIAWRRVMPQLWSWAQLSLEQAGGILRLLSEALELSISFSGWNVSLKAGEISSLDLMALHKCDSDQSNRKMISEPKPKPKQNHILITYFLFWRSLRWLLVSLKFGMFWKRMRLLVTFLQPSSYILCSAADRICSTLQSWQQLP